MDFYNEILDLAVDLVDYLNFSIPFGILLVVSIVGKHYWLRPYVEKRLKQSTTLQKWQAMRNRQLHDMLQDPVLVEGIEQQLRKEYNNDMKQVLSAMDILRSTAATAAAGSSTDDSRDGGLADSDEPSNQQAYSSRGEEKKEAVKIIFFGTVALSVLYLTIFNIALSFPGPMRGYRPSDYDYDDGDVQFQVYVFNIVHFIDSYYLHRKHITNGSNRRRLRGNSSGDQISSHSDDDLPLRKEERANYGSTNESDIETASLVGGTTETSVDQ